MTGERCEVCGLRSEQEIRYRLKQLQGFREWCLEVGMRKMAEYVEHEIALLRWVLCEEGAGG